MSHPSRRLKRPPRRAPDPQTHWSARLTTVAPPWPAARAPRRFRTTVDAAAQRFADVVAREVQRMERARHNTDPIAERTLAVVTGCVQTLHGAATDPTAGAGDRRAAARALGAALMVVHLVDGVVHGPARWALVEAQNTITDALAQGTWPGDAAALVRGQTDVVRRWAAACRRTGGEAPELLRYAVRRTAWSIPLWAALGQSLVRHADASVDACAPLAGALLAAHAAYESIPAGERAGRPSGRARMDGTVWAGLEQVVLAHQARPDARTARAQAPRSARRM